MLKYFKPLPLFVLGWALFLFTPLFADIGLINGLAQLALFALVVCLPAWKTGRLSYVDIGWPLGLAVIGVVTYLMADGDTLRKNVVSFVYLFIGLRMFYAAIKMLKIGAFNQELPRYQFQRRRWEKTGKTNTMLAIQVDALLQGIANASFLCAPAFVIAMNPNPEYSPLEVVGLALWLAAFAMETIADKQKQAFMQDMKRRGEKLQVCNVGLWRYSRHPNYFAEWMVWNALVIAAIPSFLELFGSVPLVNWALIGAVLLYASFIMYNTLVFFTGAIPSEYYSVQKRPAYKQYQQETNMFFPGPVKQTQQSPAEEASS
jgi:steroid 5-alpha reductase family enzyme